MDFPADDLILFSYVMEAGSFAGAAERLGLPKSTVSRRITALEQRLGERLLMRSTRWLAITAFGAAVLERAQVLRNEMDTVAAMALSQGDSLRGRLRVSIPPGFSEGPMAPVMMSFASRYPQVQLELQVSARLVDLLREKFDLALRVAHKLPDDNNLVARPLCKMPWGLYASPDYLARCGAPATPQALDRHACLQFFVRSHEVLPWQLERGKEVWHHTPAGPTGGNSLVVMRMAALAGMGIAPIDCDLATGPVAKGALVQVLPDWIPPAPTVWAVTPSRHLVPARTRALVHMLAAALQGTEAETARLG